MTAVDVLLGLAPEAGPSCVALLLAVEKVNDSGRRVPCQTRPDSWSDDATRDERQEAEVACGWCPVIDVCRDYAQAGRETCHVWGGIDRGSRATKQKQNVSGAAAHDNHEKENLR